MKNQPQNQTELKELNVKIEKDVVEAFERMSKNTGTPIADLVVISMKRFRSAHSDWDVTPKKK